MMISTGFSGFHACAVAAPVESVSNAAAAAVRAKYRAIVMMIRSLAGRAVRAACGAAMLFVSAV
jgi:hypothetical protein